LQIIIRLILVLCLVVAGLYGFLYFKTKTFVDQAISYASPYISITYKGISNPMDGSIALKGVTMRPKFSSRMDSGEVYIRSIEFRLNSVLDFIFLKGKIQKATKENQNLFAIAPKIQMKLDHVRSETKQFSEWWGEGEDGYLDRIIARARAQGCGDTKSIDFAKFIPKLGYETIEYSVILDYEYDKYASVIDLENEWTIHDLTSFSLKGSISNVTSIADFQDPSNLLTKVYFVHQDLGYNKGWIDFCAKESGIKADNYINHHMKHLKSFLSKANVIFSDELYNTYKASLNQAKVTFKFMPESINSALQIVDRYKPSSWPAVLNMTVKVDGKEINDLSMNWNRDTVVKDLLEVKSHDEKTKQQILNETNSPKKKKTKKKKRSYIEVSIHELKNYVNSYVKITLKSGKKFKGLIVGDEENSITLRVRTRGGNMEMQMNYEKIKKASVYK